MANLYTVGIELQTSAAQQAIAQLERSFQGMSASASAAQQASMALGQGLTRSGQAANGAATEFQRASDEAERLAAQQQQLEKNAAAAATAFGVLAYKAQQYIRTAIQVGEATQGAIAANATLTNDSAGLDKTFQQLAKTLNYQTNSLELNKAAYDVLSAGITKTADITQVMEAGVKGAKGGFSDLATITDATTTIMNAYGKSASEAAKIVDQMIQTQNDGKIVAREYGHHIGVVASGAANAGVKLEELNAAVGVATVAGVQVSSTFTGLRQAISSIVSPSEQAKKLAKELGIEFSQQAIKSKGFAGVLKDVAEATKGNADQITKLFGSVEAKAVLDPILNDLPKYNQFLQNQTAIAGQAAAATDKVNKGLQAQQGALANIAVEVNRKVFDTLEPALAATAGAAFSLAKAFTELPEPIQKGVIGVGLFTAGIAATSAAILAFNALGLTTATVIGAMGTAFTVATGPIGLTAAAVTAAYLVFKQLWDSSKMLRDSLDRLGNASNRFFAGFSKSAKEGEQASKGFTDQLINGFTTAGDVVSVLIDYVTNAIDYYNYFFNTSAKKLDETTRAVKQSLNVMIEAGLLAFDTKMFGPVKAYQNFQKRELERQKRERAEWAEEMLRLVTKPPAPPVRPANNIVPTKGNLTNPATSSISEDEKTQKEREKLEKQYQADKLRYEKELRDQKLQNERDLADKRRVEFEKARDKERRAWEDTRSFENGMFDLKRGQEQKLFELKRRHQDLLLQRELQGQSEIVRAVIQAHNEVKQVDVNSSVNKAQYDADMADLRRQRQQLLEQRKREESEAAKVRAFNQRQFVSVPQERTVTPTMPGQAVNLSSQAAIANISNLSGIKGTKIVVTRSGQKDSNGLEILQYSLVKDGQVIDSFVGGVTGQRRTQKDFGTSRTHIANSMTPAPDGVWSINKQQAKQVLGQNLSGYNPDRVPSGSIGPAWIAVTPSFSTGRSGIGFHLDNITPGSAGCLVFTDPAYIKRIADWVVNSGASNLVVSTKGITGQAIASQPQAQPVSYSLSNEKTVKASFYGGPTDRQWHGRKTASGEIYDENGLTVAVPYRSRTDKRPSIPFGTVLEATNLANGQRVKVRVTDTGNFGTDPQYGRRGLDFSYGAAKALGMTQAGVAQVRYRITNPNEKPSANEGMPQSPIIDWKKTPYAQVTASEPRDITNQLKLLDARINARKAEYEAQKEIDRLTRENAEKAKAVMGTNIVNQQLSGEKDVTKELQSQLNILGLQGEARDKFIAQSKAQKQFAQQVLDLEKFLGELKANNSKDPLIPDVEKLIKELKDGQTEYEKMAMANIQLNNAIASLQTGFDGLDRELNSAIQVNNELNNQLTLMQLKGDEQSRYQVSLNVEKATKQQIATIEENIAALRKNDPNSPYLATLETNLDQVRKMAAELEYVYTRNNAMNQAIANMDEFQEYQDGLKSASYEVAVLSNQSDQAARMAESMGNAFGDAFTRFATGAATAQDAGVNFLTGLSNAFASEVQRMLAIAATSQLLPMLSGMFGGGQAPSLFSTVATGLTGFNMGGDFAIDSSTAIPQFVFKGPMLAEGGIVDKPTIAMIGEGSEPEAVIPLSKLNRGGGSTTIHAPVSVTVNNDGSTKVESNQAGELGKVIQQAVVNELVRQQRPGGLIAKR